MTVVRNEMESGENNPLGILVERTLSTAYLWHNYGKSTIGARSDIEGVPIESEDVVEAVAVAGEALGVFGEGVARTHKSMHEDDGTMCGITFVGFV